MFNFFRPRSYYDQLAEEAYSDPQQLTYLIRLSAFDERVYASLIPHASTLITRTMQHDAEAAQCLARGVFYTREFGDRTMNHFVSIASALSQTNDPCAKVPLCELIRNMGRIQPYRGSLLNYSESFRHLLIERDPFHERAVTSCLAYVFCDDFLGDAIAKLQYKTDILNYINNVFVRSVDYAAWRYSVRCLSLAGGYNEDQSDVDRVRGMVHVLTHTLHEALTFFVVGYVYARIRHHPRGLYKKYVPRWVAARRALLTALYTSVLGVYSGSYSIWVQDKLREQYSAARQRELRRYVGAKQRAAGARLGSPEELEKRRATLEDISVGTNVIAHRQMRAYALTIAGLLVSVAPTYPASIPRWMGDVRMKDPWLPVYFPVLMGVPAPSRRLVPYVLFPFVMGKAIVHCIYGTTTVHDWMVPARGRASEES